MLMEPGPLFNIEVGGRGDHGEFDRRVQAGSHKQGNYSATAVAHQGELLDTVRPNRLIQGLGHGGNHYFRVTTRGPQVCVAGRCACIAVVARPAQVEGGKWVLYHELRRQGATPSGVGGRSMALPRSAITADVHPQVRNISGSFTLVILGKTGSYYLFYC